MHATTEPRSHAERLSVHLASGDLLGGFLFRQPRFGGGLILQPRRRDHREHFENLAPEQRICPPRIALHLDPKVGEFRDFREARVHACELTTRVHAANVACSPNTQISLAQPQT